MIQAFDIQESLFYNPVYGLGSLVVPVGLKGFFYTAILDMVSINNCYSMIH